MHEYDISLKLLLRSASAGILRSLTGGVEVTKWLDVEMPEMRSTRVDLLGETAEGDLIHIELQSTNDPAMTLRMMEYCIRVYRLFGRLPRQILLYVGDANMRMGTELSAPHLFFRYEAVDIRDFDGDKLLESAQPGDNVIAVLARLRDRQEAVRTILERIAGLEPAERDTALKQLITLAGLRRLEEFVEKEARKMPILNDIMDHKVLGREFKRGLQEGLQEGRQEGRQEGERKILRRQMEKRFGVIPEWVDQRLSVLSEHEIEELGVRLLDTHTLEELLP
jgi:predicted transposase YdaD